MQKNTLFKSAIKLAIFWFSLTNSAVFAADGSSDSVPTEATSATEAQAATKTTELTGAQADNQPLSPESLAINVWNRYVRKFRRDHNLGLSVGFAETKWEARKFGDYRGKNYNSKQFTIITDYTFHILIGGKSGYFLGTNTGFVYTPPDNIDNEFRPSSSWLLPGIRGGIVYNYDPTGRVFIGGGAQLERFQELRTHRLTGAWNNAAMTGESMHLFIGADMFFSLNSALRFSWGETRCVLQSPADSEDYLVNASIVKRSFGGDFGFLYHFL
jgi:hypothetical protein